MEKQKQQEYAEKAEKEKKKKQNALIQSLFKTVVDIQKTEDGASKFLGAFIIKLYFSRLQKNIV